MNKKSILFCQCLSKQGTGVRNRVNRPFLPKGS